MVIDVDRIIENIDSKLIITTSNDINFNQPITIFLNGVGQINISLNEKVSNNKIDVTGFDISIIDTISIVYEAV